MKIICIGQNYSDHNKEMGSSTAREPIFFFKPETALLRNNEDFYIPEFSQEINCEVEFVVKIDRVVKSLDRQFASRCYTQVGVGVNFTAQDLQRECIERGLPWEKAKAFDKSSATPKQFIPLCDLGGDIGNLDFYLLLNGNKVQSANTSEMIFDVNTIIEHISRFTTFKIGDLIYTGTPCGVGKVEIGDHLEAYVEGRKLLDFYIR